MNHSLPGRALSSVPTTLELQLPGLSSFVYLSAFTEVAWTGGCCRYVFDLNLIAEGAGTCPFVL